jgi:hypothetical protein
MFDLVFNFDPNETPKNIHEYTHLNTQYIHQLLKHTQDVDTLEDATGLYFLRAQELENCLYLPLHFKVVDGKKWVMFRLKHNI